MLGPQFIGYPFPRLRDTHAVQYAKKYANQSDDEWELYNMGQEDAKMHIDAALDPTSDAIGRLSRSLLGESFRKRHEK